MPNAPFPDWLKRPWPSGDTFSEVKDLLGDLHLKTVCQSAHCPNQSECWQRGTATFMVLGNTCTRHCTYCAVNSGKPLPPDMDEPEHVAEAVRRLGLAHAVLTSVTRDDLPDGGAKHIADTIRAIERVMPATTLEVLVQDFDGDASAIGTVLDAGPEIFSHNIETVERLHREMRDRRFSYAGALDVIRIASERVLASGERTAHVKSAIMLGCGETPDDIEATLRDLHAAGCNAVALGQYLQPTAKHRAVARFVSPDEFAQYETLAYDIGFDFAVGGPFVRSSYRSETLIERHPVGSAAEGARHVV